MEVRISRALADRLIAVAAATPDVEVCGLLLGAGPGRIDALLPAANVADDPARRFEIDPAALFAALRAERGGGPRVLGHYHSHPSGAATPSACDAAMADRGGRLWLIAGGGRAAGWRLGGWREARGGSLHGAFDPVALAIDDDGCETGHMPSKGGAP